MIYLLETLTLTVSSPLFLLIAVIASFSVKIYFLSILVPQGLKTKKIRKPWLFLLGILVGSMFGDAAWMVKLIREMWMPTLNYAFVTFMIRIAWAFLIIQYQSLSLFIESLTEKKFQIRTTQKILLCIGSCISLFFFYLAFFDRGLVNQGDRELARELQRSISTEFWMMRHVVYYFFNLLLIPSFYFAVKKLRYAPMPKILRKQLRTLIQFLIVPYIFIEFIQAAGFILKSLDAYMYATVSISTILLTYAVYYCLKRVVRLRFLNFNNPITPDKSLNFVDDFKLVFEQLSHTNSTQELTHIIQTFFKHAFDVPLRKTMIYIRPISVCADSHQIEMPEIQTSIERFLSEHDNIICGYISKHKILMYDEIDFNNFYDEDEVQKFVLEFLDAVNADVFLPLYEKQKIIGYIIVERHSRHKEFNDSVERDEMLVFASYLGNILNLLHAHTAQKNINIEKELKEEIYYNRQEMSQFKESIRSFLRYQQKEIGIIFHKNRRFIFANQAAKELIPINVNNQEGHPISQALKKIARQTQEYKTPQTDYIKDSSGSRLVLCGVPSLEQSNVIITIHRPEISDVITNQLSLLKDPSAWDYLLYLETTKAGQLINQLIPGSGEQLLNVKITLLKMSLGKKALLLKFPEADIAPTVELLHHLSGRETMQSVIVDLPEKNNEIGIKIFGINPSFDSQQFPPALLKKLDGNGTLFIKNVDLLSLETQEYLAAYILYGNYRMLKSDHNISSDVRILCSTHQDLQALVNNNSFSKNLFTLLQNNTLVFPSLLSIDESELHQVIISLTEQALITQTFKNLLELTDKERNKLLSRRPESFHELKSKVQQALIEKSKKNQIYDETQFDPAYAISDPELLDASRLGKHALRDAKIMALLWSKFKNQNQIATFLGVNRSSVNRRCKDYNLQ